MVLDNVLKGLIKINVANKASVPKTEIDAVVRSMTIKILTSLAES